MNYTPLPSHMLESIAPREQIQHHDHKTIGLVTKAMAGVVLVLFIVLGTFTVLLFQGPKVNSRASDLPPTPRIIIPTIFMVPSTGSGDLSK